MTAAAGRPPTEAPTGVGATTVKAIAWSGVGATVTQVISFAGALVVIRLVSPAQFGVMALAVAVAGLATTLADTGLSTAIAQRSEVTRSHESSAFWLQLLVSTAVTGAVIALSRPLAGLFHNPSMRAPLVALSCCLVLQGLSAVPRALLVRSLQMNRLAVIDMVAAASGALVGLLTALAHHGVWALVSTTVTLTTVSAVGAFLASGWLPARSLGRTALRDLWGFARPLYGSVIVNYLVRNGDNMLIGRFLGPLQLGLYSRAYALLLVPTRQITGVVGGALQVTLSRIAGDKDRSRRIYLDTCGHIAFLTMPLMLLIAVLAEDFVPVVMGEQWAAAIPAVRILALVGVIEPLVSTCGWIYFAQGRTDLSFRISLLLGPLYLAAIGGGVYAGSATSASMAYLALNVITIPVLLASAGRLIDVRLRDYARAAGPALIAAGIAAAAAAGTQRLLLLAGEPAALRLVAAAATGGLTYLLTARRLGLPAMTTLVGGAARARARLTRRVSR